MRNKKQWAPQFLLNTEIKASSRELLLNRDTVFRTGLLKLLAIKDSDIRILTLGQSRDAIDKGFMRAVRCPPSFLSWAFSTGGFFVSMLLIQRDEGRIFLL